MQEIEPKVSADGFALEELLGIDMNEIYEEANRQNLKDEGIEPSEGSSANS